MVSFKNSEIKVILDAFEYIQRRAEMLDQRSIDKMKDKSILVLIKKLRRALQPIKISSRKSKGRELQKEICRDIAEMLNIEYKQDDDQCLIHSRSMGVSGTDIILRGEVFNKFQFDIECKRTERLVLNEAIAQAKENTKVGRDWLLIHKINRDGPITILSWDAFKRLFKKGLE